jgi:hypothetical protein
LTGRGKKWNKMNKLEAELCWLDSGMEIRKQSSVNLLHRNDSLWKEWIGIEFAIEVGPNFHSEPDKSFPNVLNITWMSVNAAVRVGHRLVRVPVWPFARVKKNAILSEERGRRVRTRRGKWWKDGSQLLECCSEGVQHFQWGQEWCDWSDTVQNRKCRFQEHSSRTKTVQWVFRH